jgi:hypothetical protein
LYICQSITNVGDTFISYRSGGSFSLKDCLISVAKGFSLWEAESRGWNGTFMILSCGSFSFVNTNFKDILINDGYVFISADLVNGNTFIIDGCKFIGCGCYGEEIEFTENDKLTIINTTSENYMGAKDETQIKNIFSCIYTNKENQENTCKETKKTCTEILEKEICIFKGAAKAENGENKNCIWISEEEIDDDNIRCQEVKERCELITRGENSCEQLGVVEFEGVHINCVWIENKCFEEFRTCEEIADSSICEIDGVVVLSDGTISKCAWINNQCYKVDDGEMKDRKSKTSKIASLWWMFLVIGLFVLILLVLLSIFLILKKRKKKSKSLEKEVKVYLYFP